MVSGREDDPFPRTLGFLIRRAKIGVFPVHRLVHVTLRVEAPSLEEGFVHLFHEGVEAVVRAVESHPETGCSPRPFFTQATRASIIVLREEMFCLS